MLSNLPGSLIRCFERREHALQFIAGQIRFGLLDFYRKIEGARQDSREGLVSFDWNKKAPQIVIDPITRQTLGQSESNQNIHYSGWSLNPRYILSTSDPDADRSRLIETYGPFIVRINNPIALLERVQIAWQKHVWALDGSAFVAPVVYNKDDVIDANPFLIAPAHYSYCQKPQSSLDDKEFRYVLTCSVDAKRALTDHLTLSVPDCSDILNLEDKPANSNPLAIRIPNAVTVGAMQEADRGEGKRHVCADTAFKELGI